MIQLKPLDSNVPIFKQVGADVSSVVLMNVFQVAESNIPALLAAWENDANWMKKQPGFISTRLHRGIAGSTVFLNYAVWESVAHFWAAFDHPDFKWALEQYFSSSVASPHLFTQLSVPNLCVGPNLRGSPPWLLKSTSYHFAPSTPYPRSPPRVLYVLGTRLRSRARPAGRSTSKRPRVSIR